MKSLSHACRLVVAVIVVGEGASAFARVNLTPRLDCTTDKSPISYACGETATVTFTTPNTNGLDVVWTVRKDYDRSTVTGTGSVVKVSLDRPGFVCIEAHCGDGRWPLCYQASVGFDVDKIRVTSKRPSDFAAFWQARRKDVASTPMDVRIAEVASPTMGARLYAVHLKAAQPGGLVSGWLSVPGDDGRKFPAEARFFGYNNSWAASHQQPPESCPTNKVLFLVNAHPFELMRELKHYEEVRRASQSGGYSHGLDPAQNARPETSYFLGMAVRDLTAVRYLRTRPEWNGRDLTVSGSSQGGLQSVWMAALAEGVSELRAEVPWNCNMAGWKEGRLRPLRLPIADADGLPYFDPCHMATLFPTGLQAVVTRAGLGDTCCPPSGVAAFFNAIPCRKRIVWIQGSTHGGNPYGARSYVVTRDSK